jgi:hypothetical protein
MTYYVYRTQDAYAIGAYRPDGSSVGNGELATFQRPEVAVRFAHGFAGPTDRVVILATEATVSA